MHKTFGNGYLVNQELQLTIMDDRDVKPANIMRVGKKQESKSKSLLTQEQGHKLQAGLSDISDVAQRITDNRTKTRLSKQYENLESY